jgi:glutamate-ammonia-ligase adenylyltransferase
MAASQNLARLAREAVPFLSHRRCRHFLASIAPQLLRAVAAAPDPDLTLNNLERVTASLGAKAVLYELFSTNPSTLKLYVDICATSPYLIGILTSNPGMIDELLDSLVLDQPRSLGELKAELAELCRGASDLDPILHSFQDKELLRIGVRDLLGKDAVRETTAALSDLAETLLAAAFDRSEPGAREKVGDPVLPGDSPCRSAVIGLGKLGGREIGYHSDLDLILVYEADGPIVRPSDLLPGARSASATNARFFTDLAQRVIKVLAQPGPLGRLYEVDMRLRPTGKSGSLVVSLAEFRKYFAPGGGAQLWERQALLRGRVVRADPGFAEVVGAAVREAAVGPGWSPAVADEVAAMRKKMEAGTTPRSLKRGPGGIVDIEFAVQLLQLEHGRDRPEVLQPNVWAALDAIERAGLLPAAEAAALRAGYTFLRGVESRLRFLTDRPLTELPEPADDREKLARGLGMASAEALAGRLAEETAAVRAAFRAVLDRARG